MKDPLIFVLNLKETAFVLKHIPLEEALDPDVLPLGYLLLVEHRASLNRLLAVLVFDENFVRYI